MNFQPKQRKLSPSERLVAVRINFVEQRPRRDTAIISFPVAGAAITPKRTGNIFVRIATELRLAKTFLRLLVTNGWSRNALPRRKRHFGLDAPSGW